MRWGGKATPRKISKTTKKAEAKAKPTKKAEAKAKGYEARAKMMGYKASARVKYSSEQGYSKVPYINRRCAKLDGKTVEACLQTQFKDSAGCEKPYLLTDLK